MKILLLTICTLSCFLSSAQIATEPIQEPYFVVLYTTGEDWDSDKEFYEQDYANEHSTYLSELRQSKQITIGARYSDVGFILIRAKDATHAKAIVDKDPAILHHIFKVEIHPFSVFYDGCI